MSGIGDVTSLITLDTAQFDAASKRVQTTVDATARAQERAAERARAAWEKEMVAQDRAIAKSAQVARAKELAALRTDIEARSQEQAAAKARLAELSYERLTTALGNASAVTGKATGSNMELAASYERVAGAAGHASITQVQAASASIRLAEGTGSIRAVERFVAMLPGVGAALQAVFPLVGAVAFVGLIVKMASEFQKFRQAAIDAADNIKRGFRELNDELATTNMQAHVTADRLEDDIAKLEKKPSNGLQTGLDEATLAATRLSQALDKDIDKVTELTKKNAIGFWSGLVSNTGETKDTANLILWAKGEVDKVRAEYEPVLAAARASGDKANLQQAQEHYGQAMQRVYGRVDQSLAGAQEAARKAQDFHDSPNFGAAIAPQGSGVTYSSGVNNAANLNLLGGARQMFAGEQDEIGTSMRQGSDEQRKNVLESAKNMQDAAKQAAELQHKAAEAQMKGFEDTLAKRKQTEQLTVVDEINFWQAMLVPAQRYTENVSKINEKLGPLSQEYDRKLDGMAERAVTAQRRGVEEQQRTDARAAELMTAWEKQIDERAQSFEKLNEAYRKNRAEVADFNRAQEVSSGMMSRHDAALQVAAEHAADYAAQIAALDQEQVRLNNKAMPDKDQREKAQADIDTRRVNVEGARDRQSAADQLEIFRTTGLGGATMALQKFAASAADVCNVMEALTSSALAEFNNTLLKEATTRHSQHRHAWTEMGHSMFSNVSGAALKYGEGKLMSGLGLTKNKPGGGKGDPLHVIVENWTKNSDAPSKAADAVASAGDSGNWTAAANLFTQTRASGSSAIDKILSAGLSFLPHFASGGDIQAGMASIVGESGPEMIIPRTSGTVVPNHKLGPLGSVGDMHIHVDARGSVSPAMVGAAAHAGAQEGARRGRAMAAQDSAERSRRLLGGVRK